MTIEVVTQETNHRFRGNALAEQHRLRYRTIIERQHWDVPKIRDIEYDQYDNPATTYLIWRDRYGAARGVSRLCPTDRNFMLKDHFSHMVSYTEMPSSSFVVEGSRFCVDNTLSAEIRGQIAREIVVSYLEYGLAYGIKQIVGVMYPVYWNNLFTKNGWEPVWIGDITVTPDGKKSRAAALNISEETLLSVRMKTNIYGCPLYFGEDEDSQVRAA